MSGKITKALSESKPIRMWIDGKCFNIRQYKVKSKKSVDEASSSSSKETNPKDENQPAEETSTNLEGFTEQFNVLKDDTGKLSTTFELPTLYYMRLLNSGHDFNIKTLSEKTKTDIILPKLCQTGKMVIRGENEHNIKEAVDEIHSVLGLIRDRNIALQFIAIPLLCEEVKKNFLQFKSQVLGDKIKGIEESVFMSPLKLHLTVNVFVLLDEREKNEAINALNDYKNLHLGPLLEKTGPLKIQVSGIDCMNDNFEKVDVLYANAKIVDETEEVNLQKIANDLSEYFYERGLLKRHQENVKLHMTLINTKYRKIPGSPRRNRWNKRQSFDATTVMEKYKDFHFGVCDMNSIHLSHISSIGEDGFYKPLSVVKLCD